MKRTIKKYSHRIFSTILLMIFVSNTVNAQVATTPVGSGTSGDPYLIASLENLYWITQNSSEWAKYYEQTADIDASTTSGWDTGAGFTPIGNETIQFTGTYKGQGHLIDALYINRSTTNNVGLFGRTKNARVENLGLTNIDITGSTFVGGLVGMNINSIITYCYTTGEVTGDHLVGGLVGDNISSSNISYCYAIIVVNGNYHIGGLNGKNSNSSINNCYASGTVLGDYSIGGLVGYNLNTGNISYCYASVSVTGTEHYIGGLVGTSYLNCSISYCYATGNVSGVHSIGGLVGYNLDTSHISNCYATGDVSGDHYVGNLVGVNYINCNISNCYTTGTVSGTHTLGGLLGYNHSGTINDCYATGSVTGTGNLVGGLIGRIIVSSIIRNCYAAGNVMGANSIGGLAGRNANSTISNCYAKGNVVGNSSIGGLAGDNINSGSISNCYAIGTVSGTTDIGGLIGNNSVGSITDSFWDIQTSGQAGSDGGTGKTTSEMRNIGTYTDENTIGLDNAWDFVGNPNEDNNNEDIWKIASLYNNGYPAFSWQLLINTGPVSEISYTTAIGNASVLGCGTSSGFCWNTSGIPTIEDNKTIESGSWTGEYVFMSSITSLSENQVYHVRAYGSNSMGTFYGNEVSFATVPTLGEWGLIALCLLTALLGGWFMWRRIV